MIVSATSSTLPSTTATTINANANSSGSSSNTGGIVGGIIAAVAVIGIGAFVFVKRRNKKARANARTVQKPDPFTMGYGSDNPPPQFYNSSQPAASAPPIEQQQYNYQFSPNATYQPQLNQSTDHYEVSEMKPQQQYQQEPQYYQEQSYQQPINDAAAPSAPPVVVVEPQHEHSLGSFVVVATYIPTLSDELEVEVGDRIELIVEYDDGWCQGINVTKGYAKGVFPRHCIDVIAENDTNQQLSAPGLDVERSKRVSSMYQLK